MRPFNLLKTTKVIMSATLLALAVSSCTSIDPYTGEQRTSKTTVGAGFGAIGGALLGAAAGGRKGALIGAVAGGTAGAVVGNTMDRQDEQLRRVLRGSGVRVVRTRNNIQLIMASDLTFARNSASIKSSLYPTLNSIANVIRHYRRTNIMVSGFTSSTGTRDYNQTLSEKRARSVGSYLKAQGINPRRVFTQGYGQRHPVASNKTASGRRANRRVVITLRQMAQ